MTPASTEQDSDALEGPIIGTFFRYLIPSMVGILAMTSASLIDGVFIGNIVGIRALAAVNLLIPIMSILFGVGLMLSIGGSVRGGKYLGEKNTHSASAIFSKTLSSVLAYGAVVIVLGLIFESYLFRGLGADASLFPLMSEYYRILMPFLLAQLGTIVLYFFVRLDGYPSLTATALVVGAITNIVLDYLFIAVLKWELAGAAWATGISQIISFIVLLLYFFTKKRKLHFRLKQQNWSEVFKAAYNGLSEFINEISAGVIAFIFNWMLIQRAGVEGVAAITVVNYLMMIGFMVFFSIGDTSQVMISQNFGAKNTQRIREFLTLAGLSIGVVSLLVIFILLSFSETLISLFLADEGSAATIEIASSFVDYTWPVFLFVGINMLISGYLTAIHLAFQSAVVAVCRSLVLPAGLLIALYFVFSDNRFVVALPIAEAITFVIALIYFWRHRPTRAVVLAK